MVTKLSCVNLFKNPVKFVVSQKQLTIGYEKFGNPLSVALILRLR